MKIYDVYLTQDRATGIAEFPDGNSRYLKPLEVEALNASKTVTFVPRRSIRVVVNGVPREFQDVYFVQGGQAVVDGLTVQPVTPKPVVSIAQVAFDERAAQEALNSLHDAHAAERTWLGR